MASSNNSDIVARLSSVKNIVLVLSGKGGVGKSTVASGLACALAASGRRVGLLDIDICGPSVPRLFGVESRKVVQGDDGWLPVHASAQLSLMSIGFMLDSTDSAVVMRGPKKTSLIRSFLGSTQWGELDFLVIDTPPGTSDEHMSAVEFLAGCNVAGAVLVTTPQMVSVADVQKEISFCKKTGLRVLGVVENMSGYACPHCEGCTDIFLKDGGEKLAEANGVPFLGRIPIDPRIAIAMDSGKSLIEALEGSQTGRALQEVVSVFTK
jgi:Mrp family chromosome partitioning ATPase